MADNYHLLQEEIELLLQDQSRLLALIADPDSSDALRVIALADQVRSEIFGNEVYLRGLIEISNYCRNNCFYCGLRRDNKKVPRYRMSPEEIISTAKRGAELGFKTVVLQSGEDLFFTQNMMADIIKEIKRFDLVVTLSLGERDPGIYQCWREAGAERYLMRHETADPDLYHSLHPGQDFSQRINLLKALKEQGYQVGAGFMVGLPGQKPATLLGDLKLIKELEVEMVGIGPFIPHPETPLRRSTAGTLKQTILLVALARLFLPDTLIPATTALGSIDHLGREKALQAGANVIMPNLTSCKYRALYQIYPDKICLTEDAGTCAHCLQGRIGSIGRTISTGAGHHMGWLKKYGSVHNN